MSWTVYADEMEPRPGEAILPDDLRAKALAWKPLCALGLISYGVYLWHWPIIDFVNAQRTGESGWMLVVIQLGLTLVIALASFLLVERRVLSGWPRLHWSLIGTTAATAAAAVIVVLALVIPQIDAPFAAAARDAQVRSVERAPVRIGHGGPLLGNVGEDR